MPAFADPQLELFCQELAKVGAADDAANAKAYVAAGYKVADVATAKACIAGMLTNNKIVARIFEIRAAAARAAEDLTRDKIIEQLSDIAFFDIRKVLNWGGTVVRVHKDEISGVRKFVNVPNNQLTLVDSSKLDAGSAAAIRRIKRNRDGSFTVEFYSKVQALLALGKRLGMFPDSSQKRASARNNPRNHDRNTPLVYVDAPRNETVAEWQARVRAEGKGDLPQNHPRTKAA